ncbi:endonuclease/exonuclease/phosphatase family protein [Pelagibacterales bacterium]|nr:endonuclease/exonuclease/phosphatase family protein [Pelagibacterales bacterium]
MPDKSYSDLDAYPELAYSKEIKVLSWNLWWKFENYLERQKLIFNELLILNPDILCLQEVWEDSDGSQAKKIADLFGYEYTYSKSFEIDGVSFGNAIISKFPILNSSSHKIPTATEFNENRTLMHSVVNYDGFEIDILCTHLNYKYDQSNIRQNQVAFILEYISKLKKPKFPTILCGDFNADPLSEEIMQITGLKSSIKGTVLRDAWQITNRDDPGYTWSNNNYYAKRSLEVDRRIDYIFVSKPTSKGLGHPIKSILVGASPKDNIFPSDHFGIMTYLEG